MFHVFSSTRFSLHANAQGFIADLIFKFSTQISMQLELMHLNTTHMLLSLCLAHRDLTIRMISMQLRNVISRTDAQINKRFPCLDNLSK